MRTASIDIGTNTVRLLICEVLSDGTLKNLYIDRVITRLGEGFSQNSRQITPLAITRTISTLNNFSETINEYQVRRTRAIATSVVRESKNGLEFVERAKKEAGIEVEVVSGDEEAELTVLGVLNSIEVDTDEYVIFDIGGGSTEYVHIQKGKITNKTSIDLGVVHLTEQFFINEIESKTEIMQLTENIGNILKKELIEFEINDSHYTVIGTAGTPTTLAAIDLGLKEYKPDLVNNHILSRNSVSSILEKLLQIPIAERSDILGLEKGREDIIVTGSIILLQTLDRFSSQNLIVSDGGVLEGIAHSISA